MTEHQHCKRSIGISARSSWFSRARAHGNGEFSTCKRSLSPLQVSVSHLLTNKPLRNIEVNAGWGLSRERIRLHGGVIAEAGLSSFYHAPAWLAGLTRPVQIMTRSAGHMHRRLEAPGIGLSCPPYVRGHAAHAHMHVAVLHCHAISTCMFSCKLLRVSQAKLSCWISKSKRTPIAHVSHLFCLQNFLARAPVALVARSLLFGDLVFCYQYHSMQGCYLDSKLY